MSGISLFAAAQVLFEQQGRIEDSFVMYEKCIRKILKDESPIAPLSFGPGAPDNFPREIIGSAWYGFQACFRHPSVSFTPESHPGAFKLLDSFRPGASSRLHARLERTPRGKIVLKGMQIVAGYTLGLLAWDKRDRSTAAKRYKEALDLAATHPPFITLEPGAVGMEKYVHKEVKDMRDNLDVLVKIDTENGLIAAAVNPNGRLAQRRDVVELPFRRARKDKTGQIDTHTSVVIATHACGKCGKRDVKLMRCSLCLKVHCECCHLIGALPVVRIFVPQIAVPNASMQIGSEVASAFVFGDS
jgi:hypothetical protein